MNRAVTFARGHVFGTCHDAAFLGTRIQPGAGTASAKNMAPRVLHTSLKRDRIFRMEEDFDERTHRKRCRRYNTPGEGHFFTFSCFRRQRFLEKDRTRRWLADGIMAAREKHDFRLIAWVFMPEHVHMLIWPRRREYSVKGILASMKLPVARKSRDFVMKFAPEFLPNMLDVQPNGKQTVRFWQRGGGYDRNIYTAEELWEKIHYIHNNPVRRKLVARAVDWEWSSAGDYAKIRKGPLPVDNEDLPWVK